MRLPGLAIAAICLLLAFHGSRGKGIPSSQFLLIKTKDSDEEDGRRMGGEDYADSNEPATGGGKYGGELTALCLGKNAQERNSN